MTGWIVIPNWSEMQHYPSRDPIWIKVYRSLLGDDRYLSLTAAQRGILDGIRLAYAASDGLLPADRGKLARRLSLDRIREADLAAVWGSGLIDLVPERPAPLSETREEPAKNRRASGEEPAKSRGASGGHPTRRRSGAGSRRAHASGALAQSREDERRRESSLNDSEVGTAVYDGRPEPGDQTDGKGRSVKERQQVPAAEPDTAEASRLDSGARSAEEAPEPACRERRCRYRGPVDEDGYCPDHALDF